MNRKEGSPILISHQCENCKIITGGRGSEPNEVATSGQAGEDADIEAPGEWRRNYLVNSLDVNVYE